MGIVGIISYEYRGSLHLENLHGKQTEDRAGYAGWIGTQLLETSVKVVLKNSSNFGVFGLMDLLGIKRCKRNLPPRGRKKQPPSNR